MHLIDAMDRTKLYSAKSNCKLSNEACRSSENQVVLRYTSRNAHTCPVTKHGEESVSCNLHMVSKNLASRTVLRPLSSNPFSYHSCDQHMFGKLENKGRDALKFEERTDTCNNTSFVAIDAHNNNKLCATGDFSFNPPHTSSVSAVGSRKQSKDRAARIIPHQLSSSSAGLEVSDAIVVGRGQEKSDWKSVETKQLENFVESLRPPIGSSGSVRNPFNSSNRPTRSDKGCNIIMKDYHKTNDDVCKEISNILEATRTAETRPIDETPAESLQLRNKQPLVYRIVDVSPIQHVDRFQTLEPANSKNNFGSVTSRSNSPSTSSSSQSVIDSPFAPNPSPQLLPNRCHVFPTSDPNTFHAYTGTSSRPTVITKDHFVQAESTNRPTRNRKNVASKSVKVALNDGFNSEESFTNGAFIQGHSIGTITTVRSDIEIISDGNIRNEDGSNLTSFQRDTAGGRAEKEFICPESKKSMMSTGLANFAGKPRHLKDPTKQSYREPVHSLTVKSCQTIKPVIVVPELSAQAPVDSRSNANFASNRSKASDRRNLTSLQSACILKSTVGRKGICDRMNSAPERTGFKELLNESRSQRVRSNNGPKDQSNNHLTKLSCGAFKSENSHADEAISSKPNTSDETHKKVDLSMHNVGIVGKNVGGAQDNCHKTHLASFANGIHTDQSCLDGDIHCLLKDEESRPLDFINPNQTSKFSLTPLFGEPIASGAEKSSQRRRIPLGSINESSCLRNVKLATGGGFKSSIVRYSLFLRQKYYKHLKEQARKQLEQNNILETKKTRLESYSLNKNHTIRRQGLTTNTTSCVRDSNADNAVKDKEEVAGAVEEQAHARGSSCESHNKLHHIESLLCQDGKLHANDFSIGHKNVEPNDLQNSESCKLNCVSNSTNSSPPVLPDPSTASYRLTHDVSFDEGSRCKGTNESSLTAYVISEDARNGSNASHTNKEEQSNGRLKKSDSSSTIDRRAPSFSSKKLLGLSSAHMDDTHPHEYATSPPLRDRLHETNHSAVPTQASATTTSRIVFRSTKDSKPNWNSRISDLSFNGGGYCASHVMQPGGRVDMADLVSLSISPASSFTQKAMQSRDKNGAASTKSRLPSKYGTRFDSHLSGGVASGREMVYTDPNVGAPHSFQQRLAELSILETDTIKYERNRKVKRKSKADKES